VGNDPKRKTLSKERVEMRKDGAAFRNGLIIAGTIVALAIIGAVIVNYVV
jgi:hypothetical protein